MKNCNTLMWFLVVMFAIIASLPFLVPNTSILALGCFIPLLILDKIALNYKVKHTWVYVYSAFLLWNAFTTFWIWNATAGGAVFAITANALQMALIFGAFRLSKNYFKGVVPYIFLASLWITWEKLYFTSQISWPWLTLGHAFAKDVFLIQWYEYFGTLGGSFWVWVCNLSLFGIINAIASGAFKQWNIKAKLMAVICTTSVFIVPILWSCNIYFNYNASGDVLNVAIIQPNIDPYHKFKALSQEEQNNILLQEMGGVLANRFKTTQQDTNSPLLILAPETFTNDVNLSNINSSYTISLFENFLMPYKGVNLLLGASTYEVVNSSIKPTDNARKIGDNMWYISHNSALMVDGTSRNEVYHKSKLVVGVEMTPYPKFFTKIDDLLGGVMGRCEGQPYITLLHCRAQDKVVPIGCAVCYESVYGDFCRGYALKGAEALTVITNDAWWGDTPGYKQHLTYASLRAIENRRDIARCANTGISAIINQRGDIVSQTKWNEREVLQGSITLNNKLTYFATNGDLVGKLCMFICGLLICGLLTRIFIKRGNV